jgi:hypothetical protein
LECLYYINSLKILHLNEYWKYITRLYYPQQAYRVPIYAINIRKKNNMRMYPVYIPSNGVGGIASLIDDGPIVGGVYIL